MNVRRLIYTILRYAFFIASMAYLVHFAYSTMLIQGFPDWLNVRTLIPLLVASLIFASTAFFLVLAWRQLLSHLSHQVSFLQVARVLCITQIAKYLPGNMGHHAGRVVLARKSLNIPAGETIVTILQESALLCLAALLVGTAGYFLVDMQPLSDIGFGFEIRWLLVATLATGIGALICINAWRKRPGQNRSKPMAWALRATPSWGATRATLPSYLVICVMNGLAMWTLLAMAAPPQLQDLLLLTGAYSLSWMIGFVLPGAPGGLGMREAALTVLLGSTYPADMVIGMSLLSRVATVIADLAILACGAILVLRERQHPQKP